MTTELEDRPYTAADQWDAIRAYVIATLERRRREAEDLDDA